MVYSLFYHPDIQKDIERLPNNTKEQIRCAIEGRLLQDPVHYGDPLRKTLKGYRKLRVGDYRVIYKIAANKINVLKIGHRKEAYTKVFQRMG